ncbi:DUF445 domain-containing protein [Salinisphaera hydrothermalis]|uniref:DUF445 domain-containing protein n=1 Tax=Salinisphaera hydrothermalis TaxID=563188 RepID=UPI0033401069
MTADWLHLSAETWRYLSLPVISALVGYVTNVVAIRMMFHPIEFRGVARPWLGWQGIVPRKASKMTGIAVDTITESLITEAEMFGRLDPREVATEIEGPLMVMVDDVIETVMRRHYPTLWPAAPETLRRAVHARLRAAAPRVVTRVMHEIRANIRYLFDLKSMITRLLVREKTLLNRVFKETGRDEFIFIGRSGAYFGFAFGLVQMALWVFFQPWWLLPLFGLIVGWATNWLALKMIFNPKNGIQIGRWRLQGLFFRRQNEVAADYGALVADHVITPEHILDEITHGPYADKLMAMVRREVGATVDDTLRVARPLMNWTLGEHEYQRLRRDAEQEVVARMPALLERLTGYAKQRMAVRETLIERLQSLTPAQFESMLRPAFEEDEWILIAVGAALGFAAGWIQLVFVFSSVFEQHFGALW